MRKTRNGQRAIRGRPRRLADQEPPTDQKIRSTAVKLFYRQGYPATTTREITEECSITPGAMYNHYASKSDLLYRIIEDTHNALYQRLLDATEFSDLPSARLASFVQTFVEFHIARNEEALVANQEFKFLPKPRCNDIRQKRRAIRNLLEHIIQDGIVAEEFACPTRFDSNCVSLLATSIANMCLRVSEWYDETGSLGPEELGHFYAELTLKMLIRKY